MQMAVKLPVQLIPPAQDGTCTTPSATCTGLITETTAVILLDSNIDEHDFDFGPCSYFITNSDFFSQLNFLFLTINLSIFIHLLKFYNL